MCRENGDGDSNINNATTTTGSCGDVGNNDETMMVTVMAIAMSHVMVTMMPTAMTTTTKVTGQRNSGTAAKTMTRR